MFQWQQARFQGVAFAGPGWFAQVGPWVVEEDAGEGVAGQEVGLVFGFGSLGALGFTAMDVRLGFGQGILGVPHGMSVSGVTVVSRGTWGIRV